ncbi:MAG TPA: hypothetical protein PLI45_04520 [Candidatus Woesebacteria bacterium]|nr:hypothetical protein [Candidatus Woesebacteria bacterium]
MENVDRINYNEDINSLKEMKKQLGGFENFVYYLFMLFTLGGLYVYKVVVKKALCEMTEQ